MNKAVCCLDGYLAPATPLLVFAAKFIEQIHKNYFLNETMPEEPPTQGLAHIQPSINVSYYNNTTKVLWIEGVFPHLY